MKLQPNTEANHGDKSTSNEEPKSARLIGETQQRLLHVAAAQIKEAVRESDGEVESLAQAMRDIALYSAKNSELMLEPPQVQSDVELNDKSPTKVANDCMILLQFHDRMSQRLEHAANMVRLLADSFQSKDLQTDHSPNVSEWEKITEDLRQCYTSERERRLFDAILQHGPDSPAVDDAASYSQDVAKSDRIELF